MNRIIAFFLAFFCCALLRAQSTDELAASYVCSYSDIAVSEMFRSGVPASITLAQGMLESGFGRSPLAVKANNHFGIKCHQDWKGQTMSYDDDKKGECFRKYDSAAESFIDHSDFLRYKARYAFLFEYAVTDYKSWAHGLKKAGYATLDEYASRLIGLIEKYDLSRFDNMAAASLRADGSFANSSPESVSDSEKMSQKVKAVITAEGANLLPATPNSLSQPQRYTGKGRSGTYAVALNREVLQINGVPFVYVREGESYASIALQYGLFKGELQGYNDDRSADPNALLDAGRPIYLARKASKAAAGLDKHICSEGETLADVAQKYAIRLSSLAKINGFSQRDVTLREDQTILLRPTKR